MNPSPVISISSRFKTRHNVSAVKNFGTIFFWKHGFSKATGSEVLDFLKKRVETLEKEIQTANHYEAESMKFVLADCCAVLAEKCSTIGEKAFYHAKAVENSLHTGLFDFIAEQSEKAAGFFHLSNSSHLGFESEMIKYNAIASLAWKNHASCLPKESSDSKQALHKSSERAHFAETLLRQRAGRLEEQGAIAEGTRDAAPDGQDSKAGGKPRGGLTNEAKNAAAEAYSLAADDLVRIALLRSQQPHSLGLELFNGKMPGSIMPKAVDEVSAACLARAASLELRAEAYEKPFVLEHYARAFNLAANSVAYFEQAIGLVPALQKVFALVYVPKESADADQAAEFLSGIHNAFELSGQPGKADAILSAPTSFMHQSAPAPSSASQ